MPSPLRGLEHLNLTIRRIKEAERKGDYKKIIKLRTQFHKELLEIIHEFSRKYGEGYAPLFIALTNIFFRHKKAIVFLDKKDIIKLIKDLKKFERDLYKLRNLAWLHTYNELKSILFPMLRAVGLPIEQ